MFKGMGDMFKQAAEMKSKLAEIQDTLATKQIEVSTGGGMVKITANGNNEILHVHIDEELINMQDRAILEDLVAGAVNDLIGYCGQRVIADGLLAEARGTRIFALQYVREAPAGKWRAANRFLRKWAKSIGLPPDSPKTKQWFRNDPTVKKLIEEDGIFGLGAAVDEAYRKSQQ